MMPELIPVDHDPFASEGLPAEIRPRGLSGLFGMLSGSPAIEAMRAPNAGAIDLSAATGMPAAMESSLGAGTLERPLSMGEGLEARIAGVPGFGAGTVGKNVRPISDVLENQSFVDALRGQHLAREDAIPLSGAKAPIAPPEHINSMEDLKGLVGRYSDLALEGILGKDWYTKSGREIIDALGGNTDLASAFAAALARTSPGTKVAGNVQHALTMHGQAMAGDPNLAAGRFPAAMGGALEKTYYGGEPISGEKIGPFNSAVAQTWAPELVHGHTFVNDVWNMRANEYPGRSGGLWGLKQADNDTISLGQHNFSRIVGNLAADELRARTGADWTPEQVQAATWTGIKSKVEGTDPKASAFDFADALRQNYGQASWESAPGASTGHFPEYAAAPLEQRQAYHDAIKGVLTDANGRDIIQQHLGLLTGPTIDAPGVYKGVVSPGSQSLAALGKTPNDKAAGYSALDEASKKLLDVSEAVRGLLLRQDAISWHKPTFSAQIKPEDVNMMDVRLGRPLTTDEAAAVTEAMSKQTGKDFAPISTPKGYRFLNDPDYTGISNKDFLKHTRAVIESDAHPDAELHYAKADSRYAENNWQENPNGEDYLRRISETGRPHLERAAAELLASLGPRIGKVEEDFAKHFGWTPNRDSRVWEHPAIQQHAQEVMPNAQPPWLRTGTDQLSGIRRLIPVEHDPFAGLGP